MIGEPKYALGEEVTFSLINRNGVDVTLIGTVQIVDRYGTFEDNTDVCYDILVESDENGKPNGILYKHVNEKSVKYSVTKYKNK